MLSLGNRSVETRLEPGKKIDWSQQGGIWREVDGRRNTREEPSYLDWALESHPWGFTIPPSSSLIICLIHITLHSAVFRISKDRTNCLKLFFSLGALSFSFSTLWPFDAIYLWCSHFLWYLYDLHFLSYLSSIHGTLEQDRADSSLDLSEATSEVLYWP